VFSAIKKKNLLEILCIGDWHYSTYHQSCLERAMSNPKDFNAQQQIKAIGIIQKLNFEKQIEQVRIQSIKEETQIYKGLSKQLEETTEGAVKKIPNIENNKFREIFK
jgi:hypothetical protein